MWQLITYCHLRPPEARAICFTIRYDVRQEWFSVEGRPQVHAYFVARHFFCAAFYWFSLCHFSHSDSVFPCFLGIFNSIALVAVNVERMDKEWAYRQPRFNVLMLRLKTTICVKLSWTAFTKNAHSRRACAQDKKRCWQKCFAGAMSICHFSLWSKHLDCDR